MTWTYDDGGRADAGFRGRTGDCVTRAIAIATGRAYRDVYDDLFALGRAYREAQGLAGGRASPRRGVAKDVSRDYLTALGWQWTATMRFGSGTRVHLRASELPPASRLIVKASRHLTAVIDGVIRDTFDPSRGGTRAVYGIWTPPGTVRPVWDFDQQLWR
jgi:hypothetical protein